METESDQGVVVLGFQGKIVALPNVGIEVSLHFFGTSLVLIYSIFMLLDVGWADWCWVLECGVMLG
jgi:hypothetical protein